MSFQTPQTRPELGLRSPRSVSRNITAGVAIHYDGPKVGITPATPHSQGRAVWQQWQQYHMDSHGRADIGDGDTGNRVGPATWEAAWAAPVS